MNALPTQVAVILGHPARQSFCGAIARTYAESARAAGADVREICLGDLHFDPILWHGYNQVQPLEPDLVAAQETIRWADVLVFVSPMGGVPCLLC